ncbi:MAG: hypothetical protein V4858_18480 [Pseudomonadota bacterium]
MATEPASDAENKTDRQELITLQALAGTMAGLCITGVTVYVTSTKFDHTVRIVDDVLVMSGLSFLLCVYMIYLMLGRGAVIRWRCLRRAVAVLFHLALLGMVGAGFLMVYTDL